ncbi:MAG TPA: tetratricopeptide repeat protein [Flavobacteriales bacterium]|nr:tetratricopeptide repeat protein [Flavobacteriales bacterium]
MNSALVGWLWLLFAPALLAQGTQLQGRIVFQNSGSQPAIGVLVKSDDANATRSTISGAFTLTYASKVPGDRVNLTVGDTARFGRAIEVVNREVLEGARLGNASAEPLVIVVCDKGQLYEAKLRFYNLLERQSSRRHNEALAANEVALKRSDLSAAAVHALVHERDSLEERFRSMRQQLDTMAAYLARINLDQASALVREALHRSETNGDITVILDILTSQALNAAFEEAEGMQRKATDRFEQLAEAYGVRAQALFADGQFDSSVHDLRALLRLREHYLPADTASLIQTLVLLEGTEFMTSQWDSARVHWQRAVELGELMPALDPRVLANLYWLAAARSIYLGSYDEALRHADMQLRTLERVETVDTLRYIQAERERGVCLGHLGRMEEFLALNKHIIEEYTFTMPDDGFLVCSILADIGVAYYESRNDLDSAYHYLRMSALLWENIPLPRDMQLAGLYFNLAGCSYAQNKLALAEGYAKRAMALNTKFLPPGHVGLAQNQVLIAAILMDGERYEEALQANADAIRLMEPVVAKHHLDLVQAYRNHAAILHRLGRFYEARPYAQRALRQDSRQITHRTASTLELLSENATFTGQHDVALAYVDTLMALWGEASCTNRSFIAEAHASRAFVLNCLKRPDEAQRERIQACRHYALAEAEYPDDHTLHMARGRQLSWLDDELAALKEFRAALSLANGEVALDHDELGDIHDELANVLCDVDSCAQGYTHALEQLAIEHRSHSEPHTHLVSAIDRVADVFWDLDRKDTSLILLREAVDMQRSLDPSPDPRVRLLLLKAARRVARADTAYALDRLRESMGGHHVGAYDVLDSLRFDNERSRALFALGRYEEAVELGLDVLQRTRQHYGKRSTSLIRVHEYLANMFMTLNDQRNERKHRRRAARLRSRFEDWRAGLHGKLAA